MRIIKPRTHRRKLFQAPAHVRYRHFSAPLSSELKEKHKTNAVPVRTGDTVRVSRGDRKGFEGKVTRVDRKKYKIFVDGVTREKVDGTAIPIPIHPSKVVIVDLNLDDKRRREVLSRKTVSPETERVGAPTAPIEKHTRGEAAPEGEKRTKKPRRRKKQKGEQPSQRKRSKSKSQRKKTARRVKDKGGQ